MTGLRWCLTAVGASFLAVGLTAQQDVFRSSTDLVLLTVSASEAGRAVLGLDKDNFQVLEDGRPQDITVFARDPRPISMSLLIDSSTSMEPKLRTAQDAATGFVRRLRPEDLAQIISFNSETQIRQSFTNDVAVLERAIRQTRAEGSTALYTAVYIALNELSRAKSAPTDPVRRQAIVLLSDGEDTTSLLKFDEVLERAKRTDVIVFAIGLRDRDQANRRFNDYDYAMRSMTQTTGGRVFFVQDPQELAGIYGQIADELANQYTIGYTSRNVTRDGAWRQVTVRTNRPGVVARTRAGYFAPGSKGQ